MPISQEEIQEIEERFLNRIAALRATPEEREKTFARVQPFDYREWLTATGPAKPEELAEMEEFLRRREDEREQYYAWEASQEDEQPRRTGDNTTPLE